ncbi:MAG TPA: PAS domain S-box protein [Steroidobacteraceae bacterium]|nr:PAS domain S-box protein [Steroidobacteraceae bacterium]
MNVIEVGHRLAPATNWREAGDEEHFVQFYEEESALLESVTGFLQHGLDIGAGAVVIATAAHLEQLERELRSRKVDVTGATTRQQLVALEASATLASIMSHGAPQWSRFLEVVGAVIGQTRRRYGRVMAFGEMVALLWKDGRQAAALQLEELWNELGERERFSIYCAFPLHKDAAAADPRGLERVCSLHRRVIPAQSHSSSDPQARLQLIAQLQQKARALEWEVQRRIMVERALAERDRELTDFLENALEGLLKVGPDGTVFWINGAGLELLGCGEADCVGHAIEDFHLDPLDARESLRCLLAGESLRNHATALYRSDGSVRYVRVAANALWDAGRMIHSRWFIRDVTHERLAEGARAHLASIVESSDDAIVSKTLNGVIRSWNRAAERLFGYSADEAVGQPITLIIPAERVQEEVQILSKLRRGERVDHFETERIAKSGRRIHVALTVSPIRDANGAVVGASKIARDITERKASEQERERTIGELRRAEEALREADRRKDEFLAVLAHELRNPLAPIRYAVAMARKEDRTEGQRRQAQAIIERQVEHMGRLLDDLLDVSRITRGTLILRPSSVDLVPIVTAAQEASRPSIESRGHTLVVDLPREPVRLVADPVRLAQILANLLINSAKYTDTGGRIVLQARRDGEQLVLRVRDNGIGISAEMMPRMFTLFAQASPALERSEGGLGIGLSLVRGLVELHGGTVSAYSEGAGRGAEFVVRLPIGDPAAAADSDKAGPGLPVSSTPLRLLVADDNRDSAATCAALLEACGHEVSVAYTGREALDIACRVEPEALLLDIGMPELNGYQLAERIRGTDWGRRALLIAITGWGQEQDRQRALAAGFDQHLTKPIDPSGLERLLLQRAAARPAAAGPACS